MPVSGAVRYQAIGRQLVLEINRAPHVSLVLRADFGEACHLCEWESLRMENPEIDAEDFVWMAVGFLYATGHGPIAITEHGMRRAVVGSWELLSALGLTPTHWRVHGGGPIDVHREETIDWPGTRER